MLDQAEGTAIDSFVSTFLKKKEEYGASEIEEDAIKNIAMTIYGGTLRENYKLASSLLMPLLSCFGYCGPVHSRTNHVVS